MVSSLPREAEADLEHGIVDQRPRGRALRQLATLIHTGPAALAQREVLQRLFGGARNGADRRRLKPLPGAASAKPVQRKVIARVRTAKPEGGGERVVTEVRIEGRAPTTVGGSRQGDHTVAETLINESVLREVRGFSRKLAFNNLLAVSQWLLPQKDYALLTDQFGKYWAEWDQLEGEDQNRVLEDLIQTYIERANKREATAFDRKAGLTTGGGSGVAERGAIKSVRELANTIDSGDKPNASDLNSVAMELTALVDFVYSQPNEATFIMVAARAVQTSLFSVLQLAPDEATEFVKIFAYQLLAQKRIPTDRVTHIHGELLKATGLG